LTGAHSLGQAHCSTFSNRLQPKLDANLDVNFGHSLSQLCSQSSNNLHSLDDSPNVFDNSYYKQLVSGDVLLTSDAAMELDGHTASLVRQFARDSNAFETQFILSYIKMSQLNVLTGSAGEIRKTCTVINKENGEKSDKSLLASPFI
jgi:peroxidase